MQRWPVSRWMHSTRKRPKSRCSCPPSGPRFGRSLRARWTSEWRAGSRRRRRRRRSAGTGAGLGAVGALADGGRAGGGGRPDRRDRGDCRWRARRLLDVVVERGFEWRGFAWRGFEGRGFEGRGFEGRALDHRERPQPVRGSPAARTRSSASSASKAQAATIPPTGAGGSSSSAPTLQPPATGRKVVQSAQLDLAAAPSRIDDVAQQVYDVIGALGGIVENSTVTQTGGPGGYADFQLSVPSGSLGQAMSRLSSLNYAQVVSRTDSARTSPTSTGGAAEAGRRAGPPDVAARQLANATTTEQVDSLQAQIHDAEASISSDQATLNRLNRQVGFSQLSVEINARSRRHRLRMEAAPSASVAPRTTPAGADRRRGCRPDHDRRAFARRPPRRPGLVGRLHVRRRRREQALDTA